jgi:hypothetical protein
MGVDQDVEEQARLLDVAADRVRMLGDDRRDLDAFGRVDADLIAELAEPAAAVRSPGAAVEGEEQTAARQELPKRAHASFLIGQCELGRARQRRLMHQKSSTSTTSPASTMSTCAGISM